ncbi:hypothetical protein MPTA5024_24530 [Microbispora sp. ATCC PTA-5024]|nr:hypothetical protein MPTA5024_24530 [Microbispora sp. ATCC PTA-5024]
MLAPHLLLWSGSPRRGPLLQRLDPMVLILLPA